MNETKSYKIQVLNDQYVVKSDENQGHIDAAADLLNSLIQEIVKHNKHIDHKKAAILAGLRIASRTVHLQDELDELKCKEQEIIVALENRLCAEL
ncbi:MAG: cell division protein ZapA [Candidatus Dependentiae bacterium]